CATGYSGSWNAYYFDFW
nr:immunoglobulin heavy chain junction region [Macaca mulatta]MOV53956.1 immunoglobulin heavy chain junction region [Macaca mulatta]MOV55414.1 immunoglobulin heavy chain junction region [Macaca mulatta]MOV56042.1 immunoglobulin heavy chain junction region [Macaca mulatta]MOV56687.1 immunoglobulin heavy chain junction region [Macaca mulatta]